MSNSINKDYSAIDETGFEPTFDKEQESVSSSNKNTSSEFGEQSNSHGVYSQGVNMFKTKRKPIIIGGVLASIIGAGCIFYIFNSESSEASQVSDFKLPMETVAEVTSDVMEDKKPEPLINNLTVEQGSKGVSINGHHDLIASMLLSNYPTREELRQEMSRVRGADVSKAELDAFLLGVKNNAQDIRELKSKPTNNNIAGADYSAEIRKAILGINNTLEQLKVESEEQNKRIGSIAADLEKLNKNSGWYHNRIAKLEGNSSTKLPANKQSNEQVVQKTKRLEMKAESMWSVNGASENLAFIQNIQSGKRLRVTRGFDIPGCGQVTDINPSDQKVTTITCVISN